MAARKAPAFQFYATDFLTGTLDMSLEEVGAYIRLLAISWDKGPIPAQESRRAMLLGVSVRELRRIWPALASKWVSTSDGLINQRLEQIRLKQAEFSEKQAQKGRASAGVRQPRLSRGSTGQATESQPNTQPKRHRTAAGQATKQQPDGQPNSNSPISDLQVHPPKEREGVAPSASGRAPTTDLLRRFDELHRGRTGQPAVIAAGKDAALLAGIWRTHGEATVRRLMALFFESDDPFIARAGYSVGVFVSQAPKLLQAASGPAKDATDREWDRLEAFVAGRRP